MSNKLTSFKEFGRFREQRRNNEIGRDIALAEERVRTIHTDLVNLVHETQQLVKALGDGAQRELAAAAANNKITDQESLCKLTKIYERVSWRLHGQLTCMSHGAHRR